MVTADGNDSDTSIAQLGEKVRERRALEVARVKRIKRVPRKDDEIRAFSNRTVDNLPERLPKARASFVESRRRHARHVAIEMVVRGNHDAHSHLGHLSGPGAIKALTSRSA